MVTIRKRSVTLFLIIFMISIIAIAFGINTLFAFSMGLVILICLVYSKSIYNNFSIVFFLMTFFFFLMSSEFVKEVLGANVSRDTTEASELHYQIAILLSLIGIFIGYQIKLKANKGNNFNIDIIDNDEKKITRSVSKIIFYVTFIFYLAPVIERILFVKNNSYYLSYVAYSSSIPYIFIKIGEMCPITFSIFLATFPSKKECRMPIILYLIYSITYLFTGKRYLTVSTLIFFVTYFLIRNKTDEKQSVKWISKKLIILLIVLLPFTGAALAAYSTIRTGAKLPSGTSIKSLLYTLFTSVADSNRVIKYGYMFKNQFPSGHIYSFGNIIDYFKYGTISRLITGSNITVSQTAEYALNGNGYAYVLSYLYYPDKYLSGHGLGSCYIAALYQDAGYLGIIIGNLVLGFSLRNLFNVTSNSIWKNAIVFYVYRNLLLTPRNDFDIVFRDILSFGFLFTFIFIYLIVKYFNKPKLLRMDSGNETIK